MQKQGNLKASRYCLHLKWRLHPQDEIENIGKATFYNIIYLNIIKLEAGKKLEPMKAYLKPTSKLYTVYRVGSSASTSKTKMKK